MTLIAFHFPVFAILLLLLAAVAFLLFLYVKKKKHVEPFSSSGHSKESMIQEPVIRHPEVVIHIKPIIGMFEGFLNSLRMITDKANPEVASFIFQKLDSIVRIHGDQWLQQWFSEFAVNREAWDQTEYQNKAAELISIFKECGVRSSAEIRIKWNDLAKEHYRCLNTVQEGQICEVISPCWIYENKVFERGTVKSI